VLLVEDDDEMRTLLAGVLRRDGYRVIEAPDGDDALEWLYVGSRKGELARVPSLIVSDIYLPCVSGLEILEGVSLGVRRIPVILITGFGDEATHARARDLGAERVLDKPFGMEEFRTAVATALRGHTSSSLPGGDGHVI
jgi:DNA-binding response OmpR family regulator